MEGRAAKFEVTIEGQPKPEVTWFKGTRPIYESEKYEISREGDRCVLVVRDVFGEDEDEYSCRATNKAGSRMSRADLRIKCKSARVLNGTPELKMELHVSCRYLQVPRRSTCRLASKTLPSSRRAKISS